MFPRTQNCEAELKKDYIVKLLDAQDLQRPETVETLFMIWRITNSPVSGEWGWKIFGVFEKYTLLDDGQATHHSGMLIRFLLYRGIIWRASGW
jgi:mannosyl-oligosaccharide alpha-1,2-mannosidase